MIVFGTVQLLIAAPGHGQEKIKKSITLEYHNAAFSTVVKAIEQKSGLIIMYELTPAIEKEVVSISAKDKPVAEVLDMLVRERKLTWSLKESENVVRLERVDVPSSAAPVELLFADPIMVSGYVRDPEGKPLAGASVVIHSGRVIVKTNAEGHFIIAAKEGDVIMFTFVSYEPKMVRVTADMLRVGSMGEITLVRSVSGLDEMVVIAYGTTTRRLATGSVSSVSAEEISHQPVSNVLEALEGKVPGLFISQSSGAVGAQMSTSIRNQLSISSGKLPLYIIDGVPFNETPINALGSSTYSSIEGAAGQVDPMNSINPGDIESISVLKDGDATAIYGSRGANGVILITTKKGKAGATKFDLNAYSGIGKSTRLMQMMNLHQYLAMRRAAFANDNITPNASNAPDLTVWDTTKSTNFDKKFLDGTAHQTDISATLSGGDQRLHYLFSNTIRHESTVYPGNWGYNRYSAHLSVDNTSADGRFLMTASAFYTKESNNQSLADMTLRVYNLPPDYPLYNANGTLNWTGGFINPMSYLLQSSQFRSDNLLANTTLRYTIIPGLNAKVSLGYNKINQSNTLLEPKSALNPANSPQSSASFSTNYVESYIIEPQLEYIRRLGKGKLTALVGGTWQRSNFVQPFYINATGFSSDHLLTTLSAASTISYKSSGYTDYKYASGFARINYILMDRYLLNITGRRDGSSRFGPNHQWGDFGSVGAGWIFTSENWMRQAAPWMSFGKLRASYGTIGNDQIADYGYLSTYSILPYSYGASSINPARSANPNYRWETNRKIDIALETGFFHDRILASASWFRSRTNDQLIGSPLASQSGFTSYQANLPALVESAGWEFELKTINVKGSTISWTSSFNLTAPHNKLVSFPGLAKTAYAYTFIVGKPINMITGYHFTGFQNGVATVQDLNKDGVISQGLSQMLKGDFKEIGVATPKFYGGFSNTVSYSRFQLDFLLQFVKQLKGNIRAQNQNMPGLMYNQDTHVLSDGFVPSASTASAAYKAYTSYYVYSDAMYSDASFIRLKNVSLSYDFSRALLKPLKIKSAEIYVRGENLLTASHYFGFDPETGSSSLPPLRRVIAGIHCSL